MSNYFLNQEILHRVANGNTMAYMKDRAEEIEEKTNQWLEEEEDNAEND